MEYRGPRFRERTTAWQSVWLRGRIKHAFRTLYSSPNHQRQLCTVADKKEVKLLKNWTSRLGVESAICEVEAKEMPLFSQQHSCGIQVSATANLNVWLRGLYVSFRIRVNLWVLVFGCILFEKTVKMVEFGEKQKVEMQRLKATQRNKVRCFDMFFKRNYHSSLH